MAGRDSSDLQEVAGQGGLGLSTPATPGLTWGTLLTRTYKLYRDRFRTIFTIALTPAILAYLCTFLQRVLFRFLRDHGWVPRWGSPGYWTVLIAIALFEGAVYWIISGFFFAGVASNVVREAGSNERVLSDAFTDARERLGAVAAIALVTWAVFAVGRGLLGLALIPLLERLPFLRRWFLLTGVLGLMLLLLCGLLSRIGLAIPILMDNPQISVRQSLRQSLVKTENWEPFFMLFLVKSAAIGYVVYWIANLGLDNLLAHGLVPEAFPWVQALLYICLAAILESPLFIAFSLLYRESKITRQEALPAAVGSLGSAAP